MGRLRRARLRAPVNPAGPSPAGRRHKLRRPTFSELDIERLESRFGAALAKARWRSVSTWRDIDPARLTVVRVGANTSRLTLTRLADGTCDLDADGRALLRNAPFRHVLERVVAE